MFNRASDLVIALLKSLKENLCSLHGEQVSELRWTAAWLLPVTHLLCCNEESVRAKLEVYVLQQLLKLDPQCLSKILNLLLQPEVIRQNRPKNVRS